MKIDYCQLQRDENYKPKLVKLHEIELEEEIRLDRPEVVVDLFNREFHMDKLAQEESYVLFLTVSMRPIMIMNHSKGGITNTGIEPASILRAALLCGAYAIILVHNHTAGNIVPSRQDRYVTEKLKDSCELMGILLADHIIIGDGYTSFYLKQLL